MRAFVRFLAVGLANTAATYLLYLLLVRWIDYRMSYTIAFVVGIFIAYELNRTFVFRAPRTPTSMFVVPLVYVVQYIVGLMIVAVAVELFGVPRPYAPLLSIAVTIPMTFLLNRWAFAVRR